MTAVLLAPHHLPDDETLFAAFTILREKPKVIIVLESHLQALRGNTYMPPKGAGGVITNDVREMETRNAVAELGIDPYSEELEFWPYRDDAPNWDEIEERVSALEGHVYAPATGMRVHGHHDRLGLIVSARLPERHTLYTTYHRGAPDERQIGIDRAPFEPWMVERKLRALACYRSQIQLWPHHFMGDMTEYYA